MNERLSFVIVITVFIVVVIVIAIFIVVLIAPLMVILTVTLILIVILLFIVFHRRQEQGFGMRLNVSCGPLCQSDRAVIKRIKGIERRSVIKGADSQ